MTVCVDLCYRPLHDVIRDSFGTERSGRLWNSHVQWDGKCFCCEAIGMCELVYCLVNSVANCVYVGMRYNYINVPLQYNYLGS